jgi:hypothetical protein
LIAEAGFLDHAKSLHGLGDLSREPCGIGSRIVTQELNDFRHELYCRHTNSTFPVLDGTLVDTDLLGKVGLEQVKLKASAANVFADCLWG